MPSRLHPDRSVYTVDLDFESERRVRRRLRRRESDKLPVERRPGRDLSIDVAVVEMDDDGGFVDRRQLLAALAHVDRTRRYEPWDGAIVVVFIHGWRHDCRWESPRRGDSHFAAFRDVLAFLAAREAERVTCRRVIGVYVGWDGKARRTALGSTLGRLGLEQPTFWNRYRTALRIGRGRDMSELVARLTEHTKGAGGKPSQLILMGHSMGGLILESSLLALVESGDPTLLAPAPRDVGAPVETHVNGATVLFPDAALSLNSAADSAVARALVRALDDRGVERTAADGGIAYHPPLLAAVTSTADDATGKWWPKAMGTLRTWRRRTGGARDDSLIRDFAPNEELATVGHHPELLTHRVVSGRRGAAKALPAPGLDFGQEFHCLRPPVPPRAATPTLVIDLPESRRRLGRPPDESLHTRYRLEPLRGTDRPRLLWNFQVQPHLIPDHNDIFNFRAKALILALMQASGAVASLAERWSDSFAD